MKHFGALALSLIASSALAQPERAPRVSIEDPSGHALDAFHAALGRGRARVTIWGASHVASDQFTGFLRSEWQRRFGDGGPGFVMPAMPFSLYAHQRAEVAGAGGWRVLRVVGQHRAPAAYGPFGIALEATNARAFAALDRGSVDSVAVFFWRRPDGGSIEVALDHERQRISTRGAEGSGVSVLRHAGVRRVQLRTLGDGPVRLFGLSMERPRGVLIDALGIPGARLRDRLPWQDEPLREQMSALAPDLIVLSYGTNEAGFTNRPIERHRAEADEAVQRARALVPSASCLLIGPSDWPVQSADGRWAPRPRTSQIAAVMRETAARHGCAFFDLVAVTGGPGSMPTWVDAGLALGDYVHFTDEGHRIIARVLSRALLAGYRR